MEALLSIQRPILPIDLLRHAISAITAQDISQSHNLVYDEPGCSEEIF